MENPQCILASMLAETNVSPAPGDLEKYLFLLQELQVWNKMVNLTSITDPKEAMEKHIVDSLTLFSAVQTCRSLLDIGSGAGFPSIPLKIACPELIVFSLDANRKKIHFQRHIARRLKFREFITCHSRVEDLKKTVRELPQFDMIVSRAFTSIEKFVHLALPYLSQCGQIIVMKGPGYKEERTSFQKDATVTLKRVETIRLPVSGSCRKLLFYEKAAGRVL